MTGQQAAITQVRETMIKAGIDHAVKLRALRAEKRDFNVAMSKAGTLVLIETTGKPSTLRFGSLLSSNVAEVDSRVVGRWNQQHPNHEVQFMSMQKALEAECFRIFLLLHEIQENIRRQELQS